VKTIPRKAGDPVVFTASLDKGAIKATSGGWAREITMRGLPIASGIAGAHLFINAGGAREMHWHNSAEWAYVVDGHCQVTVVDPEGLAEIANLGPGDLWYFPNGHAMRSRRWAWCPVTRFSPSTMGSIRSTARSASATG
jgi:oxalate decarboxylase